MNIAFSTALIFLLIAPGFIYRISFLSSRFSIKFRHRNFINEFYLSVIPAILFQILYLWLVEWITPFKVDFQLLAGLLVKFENEIQLNKAFLNIRENLLAIFWYNSILLFLAFSFGHGTRYLIRATHLDRRIRLFRFSNKWYYTLSGECLDFPEVEDRFEQIHFTFLDVLCQVEGRRIIYIGERFDYYIDSNGELEAIHLRLPIRRDLDNDYEDDDENSKRYYEIPSKFIVIPFKNIININVRYFYAEEVDLDKLPKEQYELVNINDDE